MYLVEWRQVPVTWPLLWKEAKPKYQWHGHFLHTVICGHSSTWPFMAHVLWYFSRNLPGQIALACMTFLHVLIQCKMHTKSQHYSLRGDAGLGGEATRSEDAAILFGPHVINSIGNWKKNLGNVCAPGRLCHFICDSISLLPLLRTTLMWPDRLFGEAACADISYIFLLSILRHPRLCRTLPTCMWLVVKMLVPEFSSITSCALGPAL